MLRHFSEQYKTDLAERPLFMGDHGKRVLVKELKVCALNIHEIFRRMLEFFSQVVVASNKAYTDFSSSLSIIREYRVVLLLNPNGSSFKDVIFWWALYFVHFANVEKIWEKHSVRF